MKNIRDRWPSKMMFIFAAVGSAVGLGNVWRFPYLVGKYGGGAFLFPYLFALFFIGFPLLVLELALGQKMQQGAVGAMRKVDKRLTGVGMGQVLTSFGVSCYYAVVMGWCLLYMLNSLTLSWGENTESFFFNTVLHVSTDASEIGGFAIPVLIAFTVAWIAVYFCIWKGVKSVSDVIKVTMPLPILLLLILLIRTLFLPGAGQGILFFITPNFKALLDIEVWTAAIAQMFFTLSLGFGVMITYASYRDQKTEIIKSALIICLADVGIALLAGLVVFATLGYMSANGQGSIAELAAPGPSLAFVVFPKALSLIPGAAVLSFIFFLTLVTLAIDSLFSLVEAVAALFEDILPSVSKKFIVFFVCLAGFFGGLVFTTRAGIFYLDISDHFLTHYGLVLMGLLEAVSVGWIYGAEKMRDYINKISGYTLGKTWDLAIQWLIPISLFIFIGQTFLKNLEKPYGDYPEWAVWSFGWSLIIAILIISGGLSIFSSVKKNTFKDINTHGKIR